MQQAQKLYFNNNKLPKEYQEHILKLTNGNVYTKLMADLAYHFGKFSNFNPKDLALLDHSYEYLKSYDKKIVPLPFDLNTYGVEGVDNDHHVLTLFECLKEIYYLRQQMVKLPSIVLRNIRKEIGVPYTNAYGYKAIAEKLGQLNNSLKFLPSNEEKKNMMLKKIASSKNNLDQMIAVAEHFAHSFNFATSDFEIEDFLKSIEYVDVDVLQKTSKLLVLKVNSSDAMEKVGCNSMWCFSRPNSEGYWEQYAPNGYAYVILDFSKEPDNPLFMLTYLPDTDSIYNSINDFVDDGGLYYLKSIGVDTKKLEDPEVYAESIRRLKKLVLESIKKI